MLQAILLASGESQRATGVVVVVGLVVGFLAFGLVLTWAQEQSGRLYARLWYRHKGTLLLWGATSTLLLILAFVFWSYELAIVGAVSWLIQGILWNAANSTAAFDDYRLTGGGNLGRPAAPEVDLPPWIGQSTRSPSYPKAIDPEPRADPHDTSWQDW
ncbi:hypothetical protein ACQPZX_21445 [Actinoplanes sp. CA-142083]|uniref:hypothetical protein n=1 Tax=Actinoplanes sp. CA-142083 TaxID=3239903 RepID=UPI003D8C517E